MTDDGSKADLAAAAFAALDQASGAVLLLGGDGHIAFANRAARALLNAGRPFAQVGGQLSIGRRSERAELLERLAETVRSGKASVMRLQNRQEYSTHLLTLTAVPGTATVVCAIVHLRGGPPLPRGWAGRALDLSPAYAALVEAMAAGENLAEFAERSGLTIGGARTRLKKVLARTGTRSQADLVAMALRAATAIATD